MHSILIGSVVILSLVLPSQATESPMVFQDRMPRTLIYVCPILTGPNSIVTIDTIVVQMSKMPPYPQDHPLKQIERSSLSGIWYTRDTFGTESYYFESIEGLYLCNQFRPEKSILLLPRGIEVGQEWQATEEAHTQHQVTKVGQALIQLSLCELFETREQEFMHYTTVTGWAKGVGMMYQYSYELGTESELRLLGSRYLLKVEY